MDAGDRVGVVLGDLLDVDAALRGKHDQRRLGGAVEDEARVVLARDVRGASPSARYPILLQVNVDDDPSKAGFAPADLDDAVERTSGLDALDVRGLMTIGRLVADAEAARSTFAGLRRVSERLLEAGAPIGPDLSMGMSDDFEVAVEEGASMVRVGRAIFGERPHRHGPGEPAHEHGG